jgi:cleavage and polyadenylation specificity factor subunit 3
MASKRKASALNAPLVEEPIDPADQLIFLCLGGGNEVGRSCHIVQYKGKTVMLDAGQHPAYSGFAALPFFDDFDLSTVDVLLISQYVYYSLTLSVFFMTLSSFCTFINPCTSEQKTVNTRISPSHIVFLRLLPLHSDARTRYHTYPPTCHASPVLPTPDQKQKRIKRKAKKKTRNLSTNYPAASTSTTPPRSPMSSQRQTSAAASL